MLGDSSPCSVKVDSVTVEVGGTVILRNLSFEVKGGLVAFIGPNGSGKTTLLRALAGVLEYSGSISICGLDARRARRIISYVPAFLQVDPYAKIEDVIEAYLYDVRSPMNLRSFLEHFKLERFQGRRFNSLSSGEHKLVLIAGALARNPRVLLLDEPFSHLDLANQAKIARLLKDVSKSITTIITVHEPIYASLANTVGVLSSGELVALGRPEEVVRRELLERIYGVELEEVSLGSRSLLIPSL